MMRNTARMLSTGLLALLAAACTNPYDPGQRAVGGGLIGAGTGAFIGGMAGGHRGAAVGALAGGLGGAALGAATTPPPPAYQGGYGAAPYQGGYGATSYPPQQTYAPPQAGGRVYYPPPGPGYGAAPYYAPPPQTQQVPPGSYWQPQPHYAPPDPAGYYGY